MGDMGELFRDWQQFKREQRSRNLENAYSNGTDGWTVHVPFHWSRDLLGEKLHYWPSKKKFQWRGRTYYGEPEDIEGFVRKRTRDLEEAYAHGTDGWTVHSLTFWSRELLGDELHYWPSERRFTWRGRTHVIAEADEMGAFIRNRENEPIN